MPLKYGLDISPAGALGDPRSMAELAALAERSGWDGVFVEDYLCHWSGGPTYDPWVTLAAMAVATERVLLGPMVTPLPRRRPQKLAAEAVALDHLSGGRVILGVGAGDPTSADLNRFGEETDARRRAAMLDEQLDVIVGLWSGEAFSHEGEFSRVDSVTMLPTPLQQPRIPIWIGGQLTRRGPFERAARWDGSCLYRVEPPVWDDVTPGDIRRLLDRVREVQGIRRYDVVVGGRGLRDDLDAEREYVRSIADAGATWWCEFLSPEKEPAELLGRIETGPLRVDPE